MKSFYSTYNYRVPICAVLFLAPSLPFGQSQSSTCWSSHSLTHSLTHLLTYSLTHSLTPSVRPSVRPRVENSLKGNIISLLQLSTFFRSVWNMSRQCLELSGPCLEHVWTCLEYVKTCLEHFLSVWFKVFRHLDLSQLCLKYFRFLFWICFDNV